MIRQINVVMDFAGGYHSKLVNDFINLFGERRTVIELLMDCQKWVWFQNCNIIKKLYHTSILDQRLFYSQQVKIVAVITMVT